MVGQAVLEEEVVVEDCWVVEVEVVEVIGAEEELEELLEELLEVVEEVLLAADVVEVEVVRMDDEVVLVA